MAIDDPNRIYDGYSNLAGGVDGGRRPHLIDSTQVVEAENCTFRGGVPTNRPDWMDVALTYTNPDMAYNIYGVATTDKPNESVNNFENGLFQGAEYFGLEPGKEYLMVMIDGRFYRLTPGPAQTASVYEVALARRNRNTIRLAYMLQADVYFIVQDGESAPIIFDGVAARRATVDEIFTGKMMGVGMGRIVLVGNDGNVYFGDIFDGKGNGSADMLGFTETQVLNEGFPSRVPSTMGFPTGVQFIPQQDTATGVGECLVMAERGVESFFLSIPRDQWKNSAFQRTALLSVGLVGHRAKCLVNADIFMRALDGARTYRQARAEINQWAHIPISTNVRKWIASDTKSLLQYCSAITFDSRIICTCTPYSNPARAVYHNGAVALDFDVLSTFGQTSAPAWDGHWGNREKDALVGLKILQLVEGMFNGQERAFAFVYDDAGKNALVEIQSVPRPIVGKPLTSSFITRSMSFEGSSSFEEKTLYGADLYIDEVQEHVDGVIRYRADQKQEFKEWDSFSADPFETTEGDAPVMRDGLDPRHKMIKPLEDDATETMRLARRGYEFQAEIEWTGRLSIPKFRAHAQREVEASGPNE